MAAGFTISRFVTIQSLEPHEVQTGQILVDLLTALLREYEPTLNVVSLSCSSALEFRRLLDDLIHEAAANGDRPVIHIECHGSQTEGIEFENGSTLGWQECGELLTQLNIATRFNLLVVLAACYGAYLNGQYSPIKPSPAFCIVALTEEIDPADAIGGFRTFYTQLLQTGDAGLASSALAKLTISSGRWFSQLAEDWFVDLVDNYIKSHLNRSALEAWARSLSRRLRKSGQVASVGSTKRKLLHQNREGLTGKYFDCFFCTSEVPECSSRFSATRERIQETVAALRATGQYMI